MVQSGDGASFALEALAEALGGDFERDLAAQARVAGAVHLAHPSLAEGRKNFVRAQTISGGQRHI
jgi:hypothetical protein